MKHAEYMREWRKKNKDKAHSIAKKCYGKHKEAVKAKAGQYYEDNKKSILLKRKKDYEPEKKSKYNKTWWIEFSGRLNTQINDIFGKSCFFCGSILTDSVKKRPNLHEIHGKRHPTLRSKKGLEFLAKNKKDFRPLCSQCHTGTHFLMKFRYQWEEIQEIINRKKLKKEYI